jgi:hypothetical protein
MGLRLTCAPTISFADRGGIRNVTLGFTDGPRFLLPGKETSGRCDRVIGFSPNRPVIQATLVFNVHYRHALWPWAWNDGYPFVGAVDTGSHVLRWLPE